MNFLNNFSGGRNSDLSPDKTPNNQYLSANNVELVGDSSFASLRNIKGTTGVQALDDNIDVLCVFGNKYVIDDTLHDGLTVFSVNTDFKIQAYVNGTLYDLFSETVPDDYETEGVDAVNFPENGVDVIYFSDDYYEPRYFKCEIPSPYSANYLTAYDLSLLRRGANGTITLDSIASGGTLLSGTYQFAYRMADPVNKKFTKWSSLTNPIHVYSGENGSSVVNSGIGLITDRKISITITPSEEETDRFDHLQIAVVENIGPTPAINASLLEIEAIPSASLSFDYKSNSQIGTIPLEDITVDLAQIERVKTLAVKDNRLFGGNVHYTELEMDNGTPAITSGSIITQASTGGDSFSDDEFSSKYKGHWRGEVYRYAAVYRDEHGNAAPPQILDLSGVTDNAITSGLTDLKFPDRTNPSYTLFNSSNQIQSLGLRLTGLTNHPSWARSVEIVRVDRKGRFKNILFQTPIIPMVRVYGTGVLHRYPTNVTYDTSGNERVTDATPMTSSYTLVPKNLFWPEVREIVKASEASGSSANTVAQGEAKLSYVLNANHGYSMIWPAQSMYEPSNPFQYSGGEKLEFVDYTLLKLDIDTDIPTKSPSVVQGDDLNTSISGTFYAVDNNQYYYSNGHAKSSLGFTDKPVTHFAFFDNFSQPTTVAGKSVMDYDSLQTGGLDLGFKPNAQRSAVIKLGGVVNSDPTELDISFSAATWNAYHSGGGMALTSASATLKHEASTAFTNKYVNEYTGFTENSSYVNVVSIANVKLGLGDDRYGEATDLHEYVSTGSKYTFSQVEVATLESGSNVSIDLDVWGGDCFVGSHVFKVCDSTYSVINQTKNNGAAQTDNELLVKWPNGVFKNFTDTAILCLPVAVENAAQYIQVVLESDYNGEVRESDILTGSSASIPVMTAEAGTARTPLTYKYNTNLSRNNDQKIYVPKPQFSFEQNDFGSRVIYSDIKIYNSDVAGFDIFRVGNIYDIEEKFRPITKLALAGNHLYSIHENGVVYLPTGEQQLETSDAGTLAVRSGEVVGKHIVVDSERGSQHMRGVVETGSVIYIPDNRNKNVYVLSGQQLQSITKDNETIFRSMFSTKLDSLVGVYDSVRGEYWIASSNQCHVFNEKLGVWVSNYSMFPLGYGTANQTLYLVGANGTSNSIYSMYTGACGQLFDQSVTSSVEFVVNPHPGNAKIFDNQKVDASERLSGSNFVVKRESSLGDQTSSADLDIDPREGLYRYKVLRDSAGGRLRGQYLLTTLNWDTVQSALRSVTSIFRLSARYR